jgi:membrane-associated protease RseP (regulator of RpoE activity)
MTEKVLPGCKALARALLHLLHAEQASLRDRARRLQDRGADYSMRSALPLLLFLLLAACDAGAPHRLATIDSPEAGLSLQELPATALRNIGLPFGLAVVRAGGLAERSGLKMGDVIYGINQKKAASLEEFNRLLAQHDGGKLGFLVRRGASDFYVAVDLAGTPGSGETPRNPPRGSPIAPPPKETLLRT